MLEGEWYYGSTVVDKQLTNSNAFIGLQCDAERVRFHFTEKMLYAYRSYEKIPGTEGAHAGLQNAITAFRVNKHFDIRRDYNPVNGVENNKIIENDKDSPWYKRQYVHVDFSKNLITDWGCNGWFKATSIAQIQRNTVPTEPYKTRLQNDYIETTIEALLKPDQAACEEVGEWNCVSSHAKMKLSFSKLRPSTYQPKHYPDYLPLEYGHKNGEMCFKGEEGCEGLQALSLYSGPAGTEICDPMRHNISQCKQYKIPIFSKFGFFRTDRYQFDRERGFTLTGKQQLINRWDISKPIVVYTNVQFPPELFDAAQEVVQDWNQAFSLFGPHIFQL